MTRLLVILAVWCLGFTSVHAHQFAPALLQLTEQENNLVDVYWKQPMVKVMGSKLRPVLPGECQGLDQPKTEKVGTGVIAIWQMTCPNGLSGKTIAVEGIPESRANVIARIGFLDGSSINHILDGENSRYQIPGPQPWTAVFVDYVKLGVEHILSGFDHLLFVLGLTLLAVNRFRLLWTITAFTVGHSITLALAVLGYFNLPPGPVEIAIAISILVLAIDLVRDKQESWLRQYSWPLGVGFGLLHGLGFAGALAQVGLPDQDIPLALLAFNIVELVPT